MNFEAFYTEHKLLVYNLALHYLQNSEDAQELTQDVFVAAYQHLDTFNEQAKVSTWMYRITINKCLDFIKAKKRKKRFGFISSLFFDSGELKPNAAVEYNHPGVQFEDKEALEKLFKQLNALPDQQKTALILHKLEQKTQQEVAQIMNLSPKAVESLITRAKVNFLKKITKTEGL